MFDSLGQPPLTSGSRAEEEMDGEIRISRSPVDSRPSFSFNRRRSSWTERSLVACNGMGVIEGDVAD